MLKLGKKVQYALVALVHLDRIEPGSRVSTHELSERYGIPAEHLGKVLQRLGRAGLLKSAQGVQGGYELGRSLEGLRLGDLLRAVEGNSPADATRPHTVLRAFPACYVQGLAHEVERHAVEAVHGLGVNEVLNRVDLPRVHALASGE